jgi:hypothetical protein
MAAFYHKALGTASGFAENVSAQNSRLIITIKS